MNRLVRIALLGAGTWIIPFLVSLLFYTGEGRLITTIFLFKTVMIVVGSAVGAALLVLYFREVRQKFLLEGITVGFAWFAINIVLDLVVLLPMYGNVFEAYLAEIGLRYLMITSMAIAVGFALENKKRTWKNTNF
jgi:uncharacterized membrane protein YpjA